MINWDELIDWDQYEQIMKSGSLRLPIDMKVLQEAWEKFRDVMNEHPGCPPEDFEIPDPGDQDHE